jgi:glyoxylase-like metal-dependent hydrolase (beta-lactamase superfamily II)
VILPLLVSLACSPALGTAGVPAIVREPPYSARRIADGVYLVAGDTGRGSEGRANAGFIVTPEGVVVVDALGSPRQGEALLRTIRGVTRQPVRWLVLTHHHPDHHFGAIVFRRAGARVIAHPDRRVLAAEAGPAALVADWTRVVGREAMRGFAFADTPDRPVTGSDTLRLGGRTIVITHLAAGHSAGDLVVWLPAERVLFAGDLLIEDGVTMMVDGNARELRRALAAIDRLDPVLAVPGHGALPARPRTLVSRTRDYVTGLQASMRAAVERGLPMQRALDSLPPPDEARPVSLNSRRRRNAARVYVEEERAYMGLGDSLP